MKKVTFLIIVCLVFNNFSRLIASTIGIATGSRTSDGRPLLFKNKDRADNYPSDVNYYSGGAAGYGYVFQQNDGQNHERARMGINTVGFGIVYSDSENLTGAESGPTGSQLSAVALKTCSSIEDFRTLLNSTNGDRKAHNHFGVIDSSGNGALFEVSGDSYVEITIIDSIGTMANTAKFHPDAGSAASGSTSPDREARALYLLTHGPEEGLDYRYFVNEIIKDYCHTQQDEDSMPVGQYYTNPVLSRYKTAAGCVIRGVKPGDDPLIEGMMWLCLSEPSLSIALPFFTNVAGIPEFVRSQSDGNGMAGSSDRIRQYIYNYSNGRYSDRYADTYKLLEIRQHTFQIQERLFTGYENSIEHWRNQEPLEAVTSMTNWIHEFHLKAKTSYDSLNLILDVVSDDKHHIPTFQILQNYPNPFNSSTIISFRLLQPSTVSLKIYNLAGEIVWQEQFGRLQAGFNYIDYSGKDINGRHLPSGIYLYRLTTGNLSGTKRMIIIK